MSEINLNKEFIAALQNCKDAKEIMALTKSSCGDTDVDV